MLITVCSTFTHQTTGLSKKCSSSIDVLSPVRTEATEAVEEETLIAIALFLLFLFNDTATTAIYTLSLHDALPISANAGVGVEVHGEHGPEGDEQDLRLLTDAEPEDEQGHQRQHWHRAQHLQRCVDELFADARDRKSTRLNSSHPSISYAVFCLKKK